MLCSADGNGKSLDNFNFSQFSNFGTLMYFFSNKNALLKLPASELNIELEASLSA